MRVLQSSRLCHRLMRYKAPSTARTNTINSVNTIHSNSSQLRHRVLSICSILQPFKPSPATASRRDFSSASTSSNAKSPAPLLFDSLSESDLELIADMAHQPQTSVSLQALMRTGRGEYLHRTFAEEDLKQLEGHQHAATELVLIQVASFLRRELPVRLAHRIHDLQNAPILRDMPSVQLVRDLYVKSFMELVNFDNKITTSQQEEDFAKLLSSIYDRHAKVLVQMAQGAYEFRQQQLLYQQQDSFAASSFGTGTTKATLFELQEETHAFLDRFYLCRIGIRVLIGQYLALRQPPVEHYVGIICSHTSPYEIVKRAIDDAAFMCTRRYGEAPEVIMSGRLDLSFPYVPTHLRKCDG
jgi:Mitochondrial branched-chain alpha-ketoacid dehydrogenase kinase